MTKEERAEYMRIYRENMSPYQKKKNNAAIAACVKKKRQRRAAQGLCADCGKPLDDTAYLSCRECRERMREYRRALRERRKAGT